MADNKTTVQVNVTSNLDEQIAKSEKLKNNLQAAGSGRKTYAQAAAARGAASKGGLDAEDSNVARGVSGQTGAAGRDFAAQARGLGGLVHLYATFAANLFAVSAAFTALNKTANIENMVKGLDQLGAASGKNLGNLAKQVKLASDGALSLAESMTAVAQASSAGVSSNNILRMTEVAKKASQALGRDMSDAMARLSRGITKIEPELLDELGIMVKVNEASRDYARTLGKSALALTDFEKRQGYANAVLAEGEKKFSEINLAANPYQKILASITDIAVVAGQSINKVLGPVLDFLSSSPTALTTSLAALTAILLKQAIPALGQFRKNAEEVVKTSNAKLVSIYKDQQRIAGEADDIAQMQAINRFKAQADIIKRTEELKSNIKLQTTTGKGAVVMDLVKKDPFALTTEEMKIIEGRIKTLSLRKSEAYQQDYTALSKYHTEATKLRAEENAVGENVQANREAADLKTFSHQNQLRKATERAARETSNSMIRNMVAEEAATMGPVRAWKLLNEQIAARKKQSTTIDVGINPKTGAKLEATLPAVNGFFGAISNGALRAKSALTIATSAVNTFLAAFGPWLQLIALVGAGVAYFTSVMSNSTKESEAYNQALEGLNSSFDNMEKTLESISLKNPLERLSIESIASRANALEDLNNNLVITISRFDKLVTARNKLDKVTDWFLDLFGKGDADKLSKQLAQTMYAAVEGLEGENKEKIKEKIKSILGTDDIKFISIDELNSKIKDLDEGIIRSKAGQFADEFKEIEGAVKKSASVLTSFKDTIAELGKEFDKYIISLKASDSLTKMGEHLISISNDMSTALDNPINQLQMLLKISEDIKVLSLLPPETSKTLIEAKNGLKEINVQIAQQTDKVKKLQDAYNNADKVVALPAHIPVMGGSINSKINTSAAKENKELIRAQLESAKALGLSLQADLEKRLKSVSDINLSIFKAGSEIFSQRLSKAFSEGSLIIGSTYVNLLKATGTDTTKLEADLQRKELAIQEKDLELRFQALISEAKNTLAIEKNAEVTDRLTLQLEKEKGPISKEKEERIRYLDNPVRSNAQEQIRKAFDSNSVQQLYKAAESRKLGGKENPEDAYVLSALNNVNIALVEKQTAQIAINAKNTAINMTEQVNLGNKLYNEAQKNLNIRLNSAEARKQELTLLDKLTGTLILQNEVEKITTDAEISKIKLIQESLNEAKLITAQITTIEQANKKGLDTTEAVKELNRLQTEYNTHEQIRRTKRTDLNIENAQKIGEAEARVDKEKFDRAQKLAGYSNAIFMSNIALNQTELDSQKALNTIYDEQYIKKSNNNELTKLSNSYQKEIIAAENERTIILSKYTPIITALTSALNTVRSEKEIERYASALAAVTAEQNNALQIVTAKTISEQHAYTVEVSKLAILQAQNLELAEQDKRTKDIVKATTSLALIFGKVGAAIGGVLAIINKTAKREQEYAVQKIRVQKEIDKVYDKDSGGGIDRKQERALSYEKELGKLQEDNAIDQANHISEIAGATKNAFAEKTAAFKAFDAIEKAAAAYSMAMQIQQHAKTLAELPAKIANGTAEIFKQLGTYGFPVAAAFLALMTSLGASSSGNVSATPIGSTAEEMQKTQGTGQKYDAQGKLIAAGGGVFGDQEAKSESIKNSLEIIKDNTIEGLGYDRRMLKTLENIDEGINNTAKSLYNIAGLRSGSITGTADITTSSRGIKNLFGSSTTKEIIDSGLEISGTFSQLAKSAKGLVRAYETIRTTKVKSGFFGIGGGTKITDSKNYVGVSTQVEEEITTIFKNAAELFTIVGEKIGITANEVTKKLDSIDIGNAFTSLRGLKGEELEKEFSAVIGSILDNAAATVFSSMEKYAQFGEGLLETTVRVVDGFEKVKVDLSSISVSVNKFTYDISEALIKNAGGLDEFTSQLNFFSDNFLTESERLAPITENVTKVLKSLGLSSVNTREEFAFVVKSLDLTTTSGRDTYQQLMDIAQAFSDVHSETRVVLSVEERLSQLRSQYVRILELENKKLESVALAREIELEAMDDALKLGAKYIWAMEDELELKNQLTEAHDKEASALQSTIDGLTTSIETLKKYEDSLKLSSQSVLTPAQKYTEAKSQAEKVAEIAKSIAITDAEKQAKSEAISNLPAAAGAFLEASRTLFASSAQYTTDYNTILALVGSTSAALEVQKSTAEQQLDTLNAQYDSLGIIKDSTSTMAELMPQFIAAQDRTTAAMTAYYDAGGPNQGPPLPANGIDQNTVNASVKLQNDALLKEVQLLNKQIDALRKEQQKQTADLVLAEKAIADAKLAADKAAAEAAAASKWVGQTGPGYDASGNWISTGA